VICRARAASDCGSARQQAELRAVAENPQRQSVTARIRLALPRRKLVSKGVIEMKTILLATDGSPSALQAAKLAIRLADATGARLRIVTAWRVPTYALSSDMLVDLAELERAALGQAEGAASAAAVAALQSGVGVTVAVRCGDAADEICSEAEACDASLIVTGAHGWSAPARVVLGSVSLSVAAQARRPVLVARGAASLRLDDPHILLATDGSESARAATSFALELARATGWGIEAVCAWTLPAVAYAYSPFSIAPQVAASEKQNAAAVVEALEQQAEEAGVQLRARVLEGIPAAAIREHAAESRSTLLVVGSHGRSAVKRMLFGSVAHALLHDAPCPVLVVPSALVATPSADVGEEAALSAS
jgi:nucleotide-binding universal stress UspA family protein